ncbi:MAG: DNA translocase FtsK [Bacteroidales bacterium]|nr:DNA translocase FtsK [Bacteroidales bacterium]
MENKKNKPKSGSKKNKPKKAATGTRKKERDPRVRVAFGVFFMLLSLYILLSTISYIINYNLTGNFGDIIGKYLSEYSFGIGSIYLILLLALAGSLLAFKGPKIKIITICKYCLVFLVWLPLFLATILPQNEICEVFYGLVGIEIYQLIEQYVSEVGIYILLFFTAFLYVIFTFDIKMPTINFKRKEKAPKDEDEDETDEEIEEETEDETEDKIEDIPTPEVKKPAVNTYIGDDIKEDEVVEEDEDDEEDYEDVEITVKHIERKPEQISAATEIELETETEDDSFEDAPQPQTLPSNETKTNTDDVNADDIDMEVTAPTEEKQAIEIGEHFGLDTEFDPKLELSNFRFPPLDLLKDYGDGTSNVNKEELEENKKRIVDTLANYNIAIDKIKATIGPTVTLYEIIPAAGVRISKIKGLQDDIALCLSAIGIRIIAPIPGKGTVGIEVPNQKPQTVSMKSVLSSERFQKCGYELPIGIGKTISNESYVADLAKMPHILMAGATGQGKSVGINAIIASLLYSKHPAELKFVLVDPKKVELSLYKKIERHYLAKLPDADEAIITDVRKVVRTLNSLCIEMDNRYELLKDAQVRNFKEYNAKFIARRLNPYDGHRFLPYIVLVVDEFADLIMTAGKEVEGPIARLAQLARAIGIHLIIATQRPSVNIITGTIKANFPARIAFRVISRVDSGTILDTNGADQLIGRGDMLFSTGNDLVRLQCAFIDTPEVEEITDFIGSQRAYPEAYNLPDCPDEKDEGGAKETLNPDERDPLFEEAAYIIVQTQQGSTSMLQRKLKLGYNRAGRIIDQLEKAGIVGPFAGSKQREVRVANEMALEQFLKDLYEN